MDPAGLAVDPYAALDLLRSLPRAPGDQRVELGTDVRPLARFEALETEPAAASLTAGLTYS